MAYMCPILYINAKYKFCINLKKNNLKKFGKKTNKFIGWYMRTIDRIEWTFFIALQLLAH